MAWPSIALLLAACCLASCNALRLGKPAPSTGLSSSTSQRFPEDLLAHPAFKVHFDDRATVSNSTASALLAKSRAAQQGGTAEELDDWSPRAQHHVLIHSTPRQAHLCSLTPSTASTSSSPSSVSIESSLTHSNVLAARHRVITSGLSLLAPLKGTCLYHTLDWFTYSLCFGEAVRQFKAIEATVGMGRIPAQDPSKDAYVLGRWRKDLEVVGGRLWNESDARALPHKDSSTSSADTADDDDDNGTDLMQTIRFTTLGTEQRYLSQLWTDGTRCDINDEPRSVEVQYHCNPTLTGAGASRIALIKETTTCSYVMVVETGLTCREKELRVGREARGREEGVGEWRCVRVVEGEEVKEGVKGLEGEAKPRDEESRKKVEEEKEETPAPARDESDYLHTKSTSPWLPSTENPTAISSDTFYAVSWDEDGHLVVDSIGSFAADWLQVEEEEQLLREQQGEGGGDVDPEDAAQRHLQARAAAGQKLRELVGGGEGEVGEGAAGAAAPERSLEEILSEVLFSGQAHDDGEGADGGVRVHILDGAEDGEPLAGIAGLRRQRRRGEEDGEAVEIDANDLQASLARAIEEELNRLRAKGRAKEQPQPQQQSNTAPPETTQATKDTAEPQQRKARLDRLAAALVESMQDGGEPEQAAGEGQREEEAAAAQEGGNARVFDELNGAARAQAWTPKPFAPGQEGTVRRETLAEKAERVYRDRERDRDDREEREQEEEAAARGGAGARHDEL